MLNGFMVIVMQHFSTSPEVPPHVAVVVWSTTTSTGRPDRRPSSHFATQPHPTPHDMRLHMRLQHGRGILDERLVGLEDELRVDLVQPVVREEPVALGCASGDSSTRLSVEAGAEEQARTLIRWFLLPPLRTLNV